MLKVFEQNEQLVKNEHVVLCLRMMARLTKASHQSEIDKLTEDDRYTRLIERAQQTIDTLNEYEALDFLFWLRKFRVARIPLKLKDESYDKFYAKVN